MGARDRILDAAAEIMRTDGIARATTKEIARRAGCSEAALYKFFADKTEVFVTVLQERAPELGEALRKLSSKVGKGTVAVNLAVVVRTALEFYDASFPMAVGVFSERRLLEAHREGLRKLNAGPQYVNRPIVEYLRAEQSLGRVRREADPEAVASLLMGACLQRAFFRHFWGTEPPDDVAATATALVGAIVDGIGVP